MAAWIDDRFVLDTHNPEWRRIVTWNYLLPHAICGVAAFLLGPLQFSDRLRATRPDLHRLIGRIYVGVCLFAGPTAVIIAFQHHSPLSVALLQMFQGGLWTLATAMALYLALKRRFALHKLWMMRSYGFCLVFVFGRLPDIDPHFDWTGAPGVGVHMAAIATALIGPDLILAFREDLRRRA